MFAKQLMGTAIRPRLPQQSVTSVTTEKVVTQAEVVTRTVDDDDEPRAPRIHTVSQAYLDEDEDV